MPAPDDMHIVETRSRLVLAAFALAGLGVLLLAGQELLDIGGSAFQRPAEEWLYTAIEVLAVGLCAAGAAVKKGQRLEWALLAGGLAAWTVGDGIWTFWLESLSAPPYPSVADAAYLIGYGLLYAGLVRMLLRRFRQTAATVWLDGVVAGLTLAAIASALVLPAVLSLDHAPTSAAIVNTGYVLLDVMLLVVVALGFSLSGWRVGRTGIVLAVAFVVLAGADLLFLYEEAVGSTALTGMLDVMWPLMMVLTALAVWQPAERLSARHHTGRETVLVPALFALASLAILVLATQEPIHLFAVGFATAGVMAAGARATITYVENLRILDRQTRDAVTDALTGLGNRRALLEGLELAVERARDGAPTTLAFFDLNGFKHYNDSFGHAAGDKLLERLGAAVAMSVTSRGHAYRLGGDEFCVLLSGRFGDEIGPLALAREALSDRGEGFDITAACGVVVIPDDAREVSKALATADRRMYRDKGRSSRAGQGQVQGVLLRVLAEREPTLGEHLRDVGALAVAVGRRLGVGGEELDELRRAAELHDVGKLAIPDGILKKPGPLSEEEWQFMRQHTIIGERILNVAPAMSQVARLVRSSHERWDGAGYPDRLAEEEIPLGSRVISACDAYDAMVSERPYDGIRSPEEAIAELRRNAGSQFDATVVEALCAHLADARSPAERGPLSATRALRS